MTADKCNHLRDVRAAPWRHTLAAWTTSDRRVKCAAVGFPMPHRMFTACLPFVAFGKTQVKVRASQQNSGMSQTMSLLSGSQDAPSTWHRTKTMGTWVDVRGVRLARTL